VYLVPAQKRLAPFIKGFELSISFLSSMQSFCAYEVRSQSHRAKRLKVCSQTVALGYSSFCDLFTEEEWRGYSYYFGEYLTSIRH
jgi:hypothetical protein